MISTYGLEIRESCLTCKQRRGSCFCNFSDDALRLVERIKCVSTYPSGSVLFVEGQVPQGIFVLCQGRVKLSVCSESGKTLILKIAGSGEALGLSASICGRPYECAAEVIEPSQINFIRRDDLLEFLCQHSTDCLRVAEQLCSDCNSACDAIRVLGLSHTAQERLARLLLELSPQSARLTPPGFQIRLSLTQEERAEMIGTCRETVTRLFTDLKERHILHIDGETITIQNPTLLRQLARSN